MGNQSMFSPRHMFRIIDAMSLVDDILWVSPLGNSLKQHYCALGCSDFIIYCTQKLGKRTLWNIMFLYTGKR